MKAAWPICLLHSEVPCFGQLSAAGTVLSYIYSTVMRLWESAHMFVHTACQFVLCVCSAFFLCGAIARQRWGRRSPDMGEPASRYRSVGQEACRPGAAPIKLEWNDTLLSNLIFNLSYLVWHFRFIWVKWNSIKKVNNSRNITQKITNKNTWCGSGVHIYTQVRSVSISIWLLRETNWKIGSDAEKAVARHMAWGSGRSWSWQGGGEGWGGGGSESSWDSDRQLY